MDTPRVALVPYEARLRKTSGVTRGTGGHPWAKPLHDPPTVPMTAPLFRSPLVLLLLPITARAQGFVECTRTLHVLEGEAPGDQFGWVSSPVPDVSGDGAPELLVGAPFHDSGGTNAGRVYLFDGRTGLERFHVDGAAGDNLGFAVRDAGDVDGDTIGDVIAGGRGGVPGVALVLSGADGSVLRTVRIGSADDSFGYSVAGAGDVDLDGTPDLAIGAPFEDGAASNAGRVVVVSGADGATVLRSFSGLTAGDNFGTALANLGDVTGDGRAELAVGAANAGSGARGRAYVLDLASDMVLYTVAPDGSGAEFGQFFVAAAGEIDGDGFPDLYVGDFADGGGRGKAYLFAGPTGVRLRTLTGGLGDGFGIGRPLGDLDGDGRTEMLLGSWTDSSGAASAGSAEVFAGSDGRRLRKVTSTTAGEGFGFDAHGIGDLDGDGLPELVVTAATHDGGRGRVYVIARLPTETFGQGLAGTAGLEPALALEGCPRLGASMTFAVDSGRGGALGTLLAGASRRDLPFRGGTLYPGAPLVRWPHRLSGALGDAGAGTVRIDVTVPADATLIGLAVHAQALYFDPEAPLGIAMTAGVRVDLF